MATSTELQSAAHLVRVGARAGEVYRLVQARTVIGRMHDVELKLSHETIGRRHAEILYDDGAYYLRHLGTGSPTIVNGVDLMQPGVDGRARDTVRLADGDIIEFGGGGDVFRFCAGEAR